MKKLWAIALLGLLSNGPALAQAPLDLDSVDPAMAADFLGDWSIQNADGSKTCKVTLHKDQVIGGMQIDVDPHCGKVFPVMDDVASWRLLEGWEIVLVDATRKSLIRFFTPDNAYVADPETDGIATIVKLGGVLEN
ncbi:AprI/Inh family metalloprotease inhibitor [Aestuariivirga sp. YIM B02566]|uniref:AprI/Inh family metalloprotease inhibitor n=1 Tax=Taklimakanibacter albus TaxID=2800327 RepID=A0ACC5R7M9_9HYPH|nr:AprI/Inh family metalloprotease inhibitor [Aestuariivirga sp. YIM B02566]MBK1868633.1 AprI/Inh family metalloprotease inhibitor [Aestuariivirga sp. YIM B02566]